MVAKRRKFCRFCSDGLKEVDYKDTQSIKGYITETGKIVPSRITGTCARHQRSLSKAVKLARFFAFLPFCDRHD